MTGVEVGGFGGSFRYSLEEREFLRVLSGGISRRARAFGLRWRFSLAEAGVAKFSLDGNWTGMRLLVDKLGRDLPTLAEGYAPLGLASARRRKANGLVRIISKWLYGSYGRYSEGYVPVLRGCENVPRYMVLDFWLGSQHSDFVDRLSITLDIIIAWAFEEIAPEIVLEELHTAASLMLMRRAGLRRAPAFKELVEREVLAGGLNKELWFQAYPDFESIPTMPQLLLELKDIRATSKHQGARNAQEWLERNFWGVVATLEYLAECIRDGAPRTFPKLPDNVLAQIRLSHQVLYRSGTDPRRREVGTVAVDHTREGQSQ